MKRIAIPLILILVAVFLATACTTTQRAWTRSGHNCPQSWSDFDCARIDLAGDSRILDTNHARGYDMTNTFYDVYIPASSLIDGTWNAAAMHDAPLVNQYLDRYEEIVEKSDAHWWAKQKLLADAEQLRPLALAAAKNGVAPNCWPEACYQEPAIHSAK